MKASPPHCLLFEPGTGKQVPKNDYRIGLGRPDGQGSTLFTMATGP